MAARGNDNEASLRKVYVLPLELTERISKYQREMGFQSEVEAVRKLLDDALKSRDDWQTIAKKFKDRIKDTKVLADIAKQVLVGHPLVVSITFGENALTFTMTTKQTVVIESDGEVSAYDENGEELPKTKWMQSDLPF